MATATNFFLLCPEQLREGDTGYVRALTYSSH